MEVGEQRHQRWRISVRARSRKFRFRFKATNAEEPTWNLFKFSLLLRLHQFLLRLKSDSKKSPPPTHPGARSPEKTNNNKFKLPRFLRAPSAASSPNQGAGLGRLASSSKEPIGVGALAVGSIGLLGEWVVSAKEKRRLVVYVGSSILILVSLFLLLNKLLPLGKASRSRRTRTRTRTWTWCLWWCLCLIFSAIALLLPLYLGFPQFHG